jgi:hypothetical protein
MKNFRKEPLSFEDHEELADDLRKAQEILERWVQRFNYAYSVNGREVKELKMVLNLLSSKICCTQDDWYQQLPELEDDQKSPYYGNGKKAW